MKLNLLQLPKLIAERRSSAILGVIIIVMMWAGIFLKYSQDVRSDLKDAEPTRQGFTIVFEENVLRSIDELDNVLFYLRRGIEARRGSTDYNAILHAIDLPAVIFVVGSITISRRIMS